MEEIVPNKCYNCGKIFCDERSYNRHKNRKTPCLIQEVSEKDLRNPNRCIYCNKIFSKKDNLTKHHKICKIKNGGLNTLADKVKYEETIRIITEENNRKHEEKDRRMAEIQKSMDEKMAEMTKKMEEMQKKLEEQAKNPQVVNNIDIVNVTNNLTINNFNSPKYDHLIGFEKLSKMLAYEQLRLPVAIIFEIYFDDSHPENASVHLIDKETKQVIAMVDGNWNIVAMDKILKDMRNLGYLITLRALSKYWQGEESTPERHDQLEKYRDIMAELKSRYRNEDTRYDYHEIEEKLFNEFENSSNHPAVIVAKEQRKLNLKEARKAAKNNIL